MYSLGFHSDASIFIGPSVLTSAVWNWGPMYVHFVGMVLNNSWVSENYYEGMSKDVVRLQHDEGNGFSFVVPKSVVSEVGTRKQQLISGGFEPFCGVCAEVPEGECWPAEKILANTAVLSYIDQLDVVLPPLKVLPAPPWTPPPFLWGVIGVLCNLVCFLFLAWFWRRSVVRRTTRLQIALAAAEEASKVKGDFLAAVSHEMRTPLNGIIGNVELLSLLELSEEAEDCVKQISVSGEHLLAVINDFLDFSKMQAGRLELEDKPFSLIECVEDAITLNDLPLTSTQIPIVYTVAPNFPAMLSGDVTRVRQVIVNLVSNAIKFTSKVL